MDAYQGGFADWAAAGLGGVRVAGLAGLTRRVTDLVDLTADAETVEVLLHALNQVGLDRLQGTIEADELWALVQNTDGMFLAVDEISQAGQDDPSAALAYPATHTQLISWWLVHAWRSTDLAEDTIRSLGSWRIASAVVTARALIQEAGCLVVEAARSRRHGSRARPFQSTGLSGPRGSAPFCILCSRKRRSVHASRISRMLRAP